VIDVEVEDPAWTTALPQVETIVREAALSTTDFEGAEGEGVTILLTSDDEVATLNKAFRGKDGPTNVLSFPAPKNPERHLGDIAIAYGVSVLEAAEQGKRLDQHLTHLVVHGVFHLLGYDHIGDDEAEAMESLERAVLAGLGVPDPYAAR
jgi:probable rRNA maturation factor